MAAATIGNALEFYDFVTFAFFAVQIGKTFFPSQDPFVSLMASLATFGTGFVARPIGAWVLGGHADRHGRKAAMLISMGLMGVGIAVLALTPGYAMIGWAAPVIAVTARLVQGFALGGEVGASTSYMLEAVTPERRGLAASWQGASQAISASCGSFIGLMLSLSLSADQLTRFGWRAALLAGTVIIPFAILIRRSLPDTAGEDVSPPPAQEKSIGFGRICTLGMMMIASGTIATYSSHYMATYGQTTLHLSVTASLSGQFANNMTQVAAALFGGWLCDRVGRRRVMIPAQILLVITVVPVFVWLNATQTIGAFFTTNVVLAAVSFLQGGPVYTAIVESLRPENRARAFALIYTIPVTVLGGTTQPVVAWLNRVTGNPVSIAWYMMGAAVIGLIAMLRMHESAPIRLGRLAPRFA